MSRKNTRLMTMHEWRSRCRRAFGNQKAVQDELEEIRVRLAHIEKCESLQERIWRYCFLKGLKCEKVGSWVRCEMPSGVKVTIYDLPMLSLFPSPGGPICGYYENRNDRFCRLKYLLECDAVYLYNLLAEKIEELEKEREQEEQRKED